MTYLLPLLNLGDKYVIYCHPLPGFDLVHYINNLMTFFDIFLFSISSSFSVFRQFLSYTLCYLCYRSASGSGYYVTYHSVFYYMRPIVRYF